MTEDDEMSAYFEQALEITRQCVAEQVEPREPFNVRCAECKHEWTAAYTPMLLDRMAKLLIGLSCPMCGAGSDRIFQASDEKKVEPQPGDACPQCGGELHRARHRHGEGASGNLPDCDWLHCLDCGWQTEPE